VKFLGIKVPCALGEPILRVLDYTVTISFGYILNCGCCNLYCGCSNLFCIVWVCVCVGFFSNMCTCIYCVLYCLYCVFCIVSFMYMFSYLFCLYCHRVTTRLQSIIIIIIIIIIIKL
jgi:hypothetical protein